MALQFGLVRLRRGDDLEVFSLCFIAIGVGHVGEVGFYADVPRRPKCQGQRLGENVPRSDRVQDKLWIKLGNLCDNLPKVRLILFDLSKAMMEVTCGQAMYRSATRASHSTTI